MFFYFFLQALSLTRLQFPVNDAFATKQPLAVEGLARLLVQIQTDSVRMGLQSRPEGLRDNAKTPKLRCIRL